MNKLNLGNDLYIAGRIGWRGLSKDEYLNKSEYKIINATALMDGYVDWDNCGYITKERYDESPEIQLREGDILISKDGTLGKIGYVKNLKGFCTVASGIFVIRNTIPDELDFDYLYHILKSNIFKNFIAKNKANGSTINHLYQRDLVNFEIELPKKEVQTAVASVLNYLDDKISNNNAIAEELESLARTIYDYWFTQFDFPDKNGRPYQSSGGEMILDEKLKRKIPSGWEVKKLKELTSLVMNTTLPYNHPDKKYLHYSIPAYDDTGLPSEEYGRDINSGKYLVPDNSILVSKLNPQFKRVWNPQIYKDNCICSTEFLPFVANKEYIKGFLYSVLDSDAFQQYMVQCSSSSTGSRKRMQPELCGEFMLPYPKDKNIIIKYSKYIDNILEKKSEATSENQQLISLRDFLLPLLMNGQVTFKDVEA